MYSPFGWRSALAGSGRLLVLALVAEAGALVTLPPNDSGSDRDGPLLMIFEKNEDDDDDAVVDADFESSEPD